MARTWITNRTFQTREVRFPMLNMLHSHEIHSFCSYSLRRYNLCTASIRHCEIHSLVVGSALPCCFYTARKKWSSLLFVLSSRHSFFRYAAPMAEKKMTDSSCGPKSLCLLLCVDNVTFILFKVFTSFHSLRLGGARVENRLHKVFIIPKTPIHYFCNCVLHRNILYIYL